MNHLERDVANPIVATNDNNLQRGPGIKLLAAFFGGAPVFTIEARRPVMVQNDPLLKLDPLSLLLLGLRSHNP